MRPRRSNRTKSYVVEEYHFGDSSDEGAVSGGRLKETGEGEEGDTNFDDDAAGDDAEEHGDDDDDNSAEEDETSVSESDHGEAVTKPARRRAAKATGKLPQQPPPKTAGKTTTLAGGYLEIPLASQDGSHQPKAYIGPNDRAVRRRHLVAAWYGPDEERMATTQTLLERWFQWPVLPPRMPQDGEGGVPSRGAWLDDYAGREGRLAAGWRARVQQAMAGRPQLRGLSPAEAAPYRLSTHSMPVLLGPDAKEEVVFVPGGGYATSHAGIPFDYDASAEKLPSGWMLDTGGIVTSMDWAPRTREQTRQLVAMAVMPHSDQEAHEVSGHHDGDDHVRMQSSSYGTVQLWEVQGDASRAGSAMATSLPPKLVRTLCFPHGRARRVRWNPIGGYLAVLCADGAVYVFEADCEGTEEYEELLNPVAVLQLRDEAGIDATAMSWANMNRLVVGYSDGSVALWSILPCHLLSRHAVHHSHVVELATGYPSMPYVVAATPLGGTVRVLDLEAGPSHEFTEVQAINVATQPGLLAWSDQMLGFFSLYPSARVNNTVIGFMHHANLPLFRTTFTGDSFPSCIATGKTHPYLLIGLMDGSVWCLNPQVEHFIGRSDATHRLRLFQHEHRPRRLFAQDSPAGARGASRVVQGFEVERNRHAKYEKPAAAKKGKAAKTKKAATNVEEDEDEVLKASDASRAAIHEPLTRITTMDWNPNEGYGCWAAAAMGSGLVRIMDLAIEDDDEDDDDE